jgi:hypothetical protein
LGNRWQAVQDEKENGVKLVIGGRLLRHLMKCFGEIEGEEYERDFAICDSCINEREKDNDVQSSDDDDALDSVADSDNDDFDRHEN